MEMDEIDYIDPCGAPTYYTDKMLVREIAPGIVEAKMLRLTPGQPATVQCHLIMPRDAVPQNVAVTNTYLQKVSAGAH